MRAWRMACRSTGLTLLAALGLLSALPVSAAGTAAEADAPAPAAPQAADTSTPEDLGPKIRAMEAEQARLVEQLWERMAAMPPSPLRTQLARQLAAIELRIARTGGKPTSKYIDTNTMLAAGDDGAQYIARLQRRIEHCGTDHFAAAASGGKRYGKSLVALRIDREGVLIDTWILTTSGSAVLDRHAQRIVLATAPFGPVPAGWHADGSEEFRLVYGFDFHHDTSGKPLPPLPPAERCHWPPVR